MGRSVLLFRLFPIPHSALPLPTAFAVNRPSVKKKLLPCYPHVVNACLDEACAAGVSSLDQNLDCLSGELTEVHRRRRPGGVVIICGAEFLEYEGRPGAGHDTHAEEIRARRVV